MKKQIRVLFGILLLAGIHLQAQETYQFVKDTFPFRIQEGDTLYMDRYIASSDTLQTSLTPKPCVLFVFGGAFARGSKDVPKYMPYFEYLVQNGYTVVSIDYRLGLKDAAKNPTMPEDQFAELFIHAVDIAVEDLLDATRYVLDQAEAWKIDKNQIIINGSSAGAVTVLQAEYALCNGTYNVTQKLPSGFRYAGVISFAGAIFVPEGKLTWKKAPAPVMLFHGNADLQVPYDSLVYGKMGFYGAKSIAGNLKQNNFPYYFYQFEDYGHEIASSPMQENKEDILWFLQTYIKDKKNYQVDTQLREIGRPEVKKDFSFQDYVKGNFAR